MAWYGDAIRGLGALGGGVGGFFAGGPSGALAGAGLGLSAGNALAGLVDDSGSDEAEKARALWEAALNEAISPTGDRKAAIDMLKREATTSGLLPEEKALLMEAALNANQLANSREQAIIADQQMKGGGRSQGGQAVALAAQAGQQGGNRYAQQASRADGMASQRQQAAIAAFNAEMDRAMQMRLAATGGMTGTLANQQDLAERRHEANVQNIAQLGNTAAGAGMWLYGRQNPPKTAAPPGFNLRFGGGGDDPLRGPMPNIPFRSQQPNFTFAPMQRPTLGVDYGALPVDSLARMPTDIYANRRRMSAAFDPGEFYAPSSGPVIPPGTY